MSEYTQYYEAFRTGYWASENEQDCRCHGGGWALSEVDTWHQCPIHHRPGMLHPEEADAQYAFEDWQRENPAEATLMQAEWAARCEAALVEVEAWAFRNDDDIPF